MNKESKHKLYNYEVAPPAAAWKKIAAALDESDLDKEYPSRLYNLETAPPAGVWKKISAQLHGGLVKSVPSGRRILPVLRYAVAAALIAFLAWGGIRLLNNRSTKQELVKQDPVPVSGEPAKQPTQPVIVNPDRDIVAKLPEVSDEARNDAALEASKKTFAKLNIPSRNKVKNAAAFHFSLENMEALPPVDIDPATRYIVLMTPDGNIIRMSKKWSDLVCCISGEEQDAICVDQLKKWREKLATSSVAYSPGNFGDILNLIKALQE